MIFPYSDVKTDSMKSILAEVAIALPLFLFLIAAWIILPPGPQMKTVSVHDQQEYQPAQDIEASAHADKAAKRLVRRVR